MLLYSAIRQMYNVVCSKNKFDKINGKIFRIVIYERMGKMSIFHEREVVN